MKKLLMMIMLCVGLHMSSQTTYVARSVSEYRLNKKDMTWEQKSTQEGELDMCFVYGKLLADDEEGSVYTLEDVDMADNNRHYAYTKWRGHDELGNGCYVILYETKKLMSRKYRITVIYQGQLFDYPIKRVRHKFLH